MSERRLYCLMVSGVPLSDEVTDVLLRTTRTMLRKGKERQSVRSDVCEGVVETRFRIANLGSLIGFVFRAEVESDAGKTTVRFLIDSQDISDEEFEHLERGGWSEYPASRAYLN